LNTILTFIENNIFTLLFLLFYFFSKNEELGVELLTLVNQKNAMESEQNAISLERDQLKKEHLKLTHEMSLMQGMSSFVFFCFFCFFVSLFLCS